MIQHIVLFTPKDGLSDETRRSFARTTLHVLEQNPHVARFTVGKRLEVDAGYERSLGEGRYEYAAVLEFANEGQLIAYLTSAEHKDLGRLFWEMCQSSVVVEVRAVSGSEAGGVDALL